MPRKIILTASMIRAYKACPRLYELQYIENLKPETAPEALTIGSNYHQCLEHLLKGEEFHGEGIAAPMARAFAKFIPYKDWNIVEVEKEFEYNASRFFKIRGKVDGLCADGSVVEHKTTRNALDDKYLDRLALDDQVTLYLASQSVIQNRIVNRVHYTAVQKPTIRQKQNETLEEYMKRVEDWYDETKVKSFTVVRSPQELGKACDELEYLAKEIRNRKVWYRNPSHCSIVDCAYRSICLDYDPECVVGFVKKSRTNEELKECKF